MAPRRQRRPVRRRVGRVSYYFHHGGWHVYYREGSRQIRRRAGDDESSAAQLAAQINAQLALAAPTLFSFVPLPVGELRRRWLEHHEHVLRSSLAAWASGTPLVPRPFRPRFVVSRRWELVGQRAKER